MQRQQHLRLPSVSQFFPADELREISALLCLLRPVADDGSSTKHWRRTQQSLDDVVTDDEGCTETSNSSPTAQGTPREIGNDALGLDVQKSETENARLAEENAVLVKLTAWLSGQQGQHREADPTSAACLTPSHAKATSHRGSRGAGTTIQHLQQEEQVRAQTPPRDLLGNDPARSPTEFQHRRGFTMASANQRRAQRHDESAGGRATSKFGDHEGLVNRRTTVMLRNLPNNYTRAMLLKLLNSEGFGSACDFLYLPIDSRTHAALGYAFVNLTGPGTVTRFWQAFDGFSKWALSSRKVCSVTWCEPSQGLLAHIERHRNSPVMHFTVPDEYKPVLFEGGRRVPFPEPTKAIRVPRVRNCV